MKLNSIFCLMAASVLSGFLFVSLARSANNLVSDAELALLPEYCAARMGGNKTQAYKNWNQHFGQKIFVHMHHYCFGLNFMNQAAMEFDAKKKKFILGRAIRNFDYVLNNWPKSFSLTPMAEMYRQQAEMMLSLTR